MNIFRFIFLLVFLQVVPSSLSAQVLWEHSIVSSNQIFEVGRHTKDADGNIIMVGTFDGTATIGNFNLTGTDISDGFIYKTTPEGQVVWAKAFTGKNWVACRAASTDKDGNIFLTGSFYDDLYYDGKLILKGAFATHQAFICKLDKNGALLWIKGMLAENNNSSSTIPNLVSSNSKGEVVVVIRPGGKVKLEDKVIVDNTANQHSLIIARYAADGKLDWYATPQTSDLAEAYDVLIDETGSVLVAGLYRGTVAFDKVQITAVSQGFSDIYLANYNNSGKVVWVKAINKTSAVQASNFGRAITRDPVTQDIYLAANFKGKIRVDGIQLEARNNNNNVGYYDQLITRLSANGEVIWARKLDTQHDGYVNDIFWEDGALVVGGRIGNLPYMKTIAKDGSEGFEHFMPVPGGGFGEVKSVSAASKKEYYLSGFVSVQRQSSLITTIFLRKIVNNCAAGDLPAQPVLTNTCTQLKIENAAGAGGITWYKDDVVIPAQNAAILVSPQPGIYIVSFRNSCGITYSEPLQYSNHPPQKPVLSYSCSQIKIENSTASEKISWYRNEVLLSGQHGPVFTSPLDGSYKVGIENNCGTTYSEVLHFNAREFEPPRPEVVSDCSNIVVQNQGDNNITWYRNGQLLPDERGATVRINGTGEYRVEFSNGCSTSTATIPIENYLPAQGYTSYNVITPNGDNKNDYFVLDPALAGSTLQIFNQWGRQVFKSTNYQNNWNGEGLSAAVYFWIVKHKCGGDLKGTVTIFH